MDRPRIKIRWAQLRLMGICALLFGIATGLLLPGVWPLMPFPALAPVEITALLGFLFGFLVRKPWVLALPLTVLVSLNPPQAGFSGTLIALLVLWPFAAAASILGILAGKALQRRMLRRTLKAARKRERARKQGRPVAASV
ncbi:MAG TPA: hypothetical protein VH817_17855 [Thermoleophilaceae bacterium]|jgi:hypothetical protein